MPLILLWSPLDTYLAELLGGMGPIRCAQVRTQAELEAYLPDAEGIVMSGHFYTAELATVFRTQAPRLRWIQLTTAGYDGITFHGVPARIAVTNAGHSHAPMVAEHAVTLLAALTRRLHLYAEPQSRHAFERAIPLAPATLEDSIVAILGFGGIGREIARRLRPFGPRIIGISRQARPDDLADAVAGSGEWLDVLPQADSLVVAAALTEQTRGMVNTQAFAAMKPGAVLVNIARGAIVDTGALIAALHNGRLAGAGLDVTDPEPPPPDHPIWSCPNLIVTPHVSGIGSAAVQRRIAAVVRENVGRFVSGQTLLHRVA